MRHFDDNIHSQIETWVESRIDVKFKVDPHNKNITMQKDPTVIIMIRARHFGFGPLPKNTF